MSAVRTTATVIYTAITALIAAIVIARTIHAGRVCLLGARVNKTLLPDRWLTIAARKIEIARS